MTEPEKIRWSTAFNAIQQRVIKSIRGEVKVIYSAYEQTDDGIPTDNLDIAPLEGKVAIIDDSKYSVGEKIYITSVLDNPTLLELAREADAMIKRTKDFKHVYFEGYKIIGEIGNVTLITLLMGS